MEQLRSFALFRRAGDLKGAPICPVIHNAGPWRPNANAGFARQQGARTIHAHPLQNG
jgi:hypothetical protein